MLLVVLIYLTSPFILEDKIKTYLNIEYSPLNHSKIFFDISDFLNLQNKLATQQQIYEKKKEYK